MNTKAAVLGTEAAGMVGSERDMLLAALTSGLKQQAGYVPDVADSPLPEPIEVRGELVPVNDCVLAPDIVAKWAEGRAWLAGSAALWRYEFLKMTEDKHRVGWDYGDCDLFAMSEQAYVDLKVELSRAGFLTSENESNCVFKEVRIPSNVTHLVGSINLVRPIQGQNWEHPSGVLAMFDLSICAVALGAGWLYMLHSYDINRKKLGYMGHGRNPMRLLTRILKYMQRGYRADWLFWDAVLQDEKVADAVHLLRDLELVRRKDNVYFESMLSDTHDVVELDGDEGDGGGSGDDDNDGWY